MQTPDPNFDALHIVIVASMEHVNSCSRSGSPPLDDRPYLWSALPGFGRCFQCYPHPSPSCHPGRTPEPGHVPAHPVKHNSSGSFGLAKSCFAGRGAALDGEHLTTKPSRLRGNPGQGRTEATFPTKSMIVLCSWGCLSRSRERGPFIRVRSSIYNTWSRSPLILAMQALVPALSGRPSSERSARRKLWYSEFCVYTVLIRANTPSSLGTSNSRCREGTNQDQFSAAGMGCRAVCLLRSRENSAMDNSMFQRSHPN